MKRTALITAAVLATVVAGGAGVATAAGVGPFGDDQPLTGEALDRATGSALAETGGGEVVDAEADDGGFDVEVRTDDGREVDVRLDEDFAVIGREADDTDDDTDDDADDDADDRRLTDREIDGASEAALAETGGGEVVHVEADDGTGYEVEVRTQDGAEVDVHLDDDLAVTARDTDD
mgnify:CR=1 FL=1